MAASLYSPVHASNSLSRDAFLWLYLLLTLRCHMRLKTINCYPVMTTSTWMSLCGPFIRTISIYSYLGTTGEKRKKDAPRTKFTVSYINKLTWVLKLCFNFHPMVQCMFWLLCFFDPRVVNERQARPSPMTGELDSAYSTIANQLCCWN